MPAVIAVVAVIVLAGIGGVLLWRHRCAARARRAAAYVTETLATWDEQLDELDPFGHESSAYFSGLSYLTGSQVIPDHLEPSLRALRRWAMSRLLIIDPNRQLVTPNQVIEMKRWFGPGELEVAVALESLGGARHLFIERPLAPLDVMADKDCKLEVIYWQIKPNRWNNEGWVVSYGGVRLRFRIAGSAVEYWAHSNAKRVVQRFVAILSDLPSTVHVNNLPFEQAEQRRLAGGKEVRPDKPLSATLQKTGKQLDIELQY